MNLCAGHLLTFELMKRFIIQRFQTRTKKTNKKPHLPLIEELVGFFYRFFRFWYWSFVSLECNTTVYSLRRSMMSSLGFCCQVP